MTEIQRLDDCGNSPKNKLVEDMSIALATCDLEFLLSRVTEDIQWEVVGRESFEGKERFAKAVGAMMGRKPLIVATRRVTTHGYVGAVDGVLSYEGGEARRFCDVYEFGSARGVSVRVITSYVIDV